MAQPMKIEARLDDTNSRGESSSYSYAWRLVRSYSMSYFQRDETQGEDSSFVATQGTENRQGGK